MQISGASQLFTPSPAVQQANRTRHDKNSSEGPTNTPETKEKTAKPSSSQKELSVDDKRAVLYLEKRDREVRAHEAAHKAAAGQLSTGGVSFDYQRGPDGKLYAVGGEVSISAGKVTDNPQATLQKANQLRAAALAPAQPSSQDRAVAAAATLMASQARSDISTEQRLEKETDKIQTKDDRSLVNEYSIVEQLGSDEERRSISIDLRA